MAAKVGLLALAIIEFEESSDWYEQREKGLGKQFIESVKSTLVSISLNPEIFAKARGRYREAVVDTFPYIIIYEYPREENTVNVLHVFHTSRNPKLKYKKK